ncbi:small subunit ribosomal protein S17e [Pancytospora philotis]|nr:small subunit ribosomal protein S17e [Pancytospora philotis]
MGKIRGKSIKRAAKLVVEKYFSRVNADFENNLSVVRDVTVTQSKKVRNQVAGYITHLYKRLQKGEVKGVYIKSFEQEKERKESLIPSVGILDAERYVVDPVTHAMIKKYAIAGNYIVAGSENSRN